MSERTETLTIELPSDLAESVRSAVESGQYESANEVVCFALDHHLSTDVAEPETETLRRLWQEGRDCGSALRGEEVFSRLRQKYAKGAAGK
jgi:antitoxin ParD1/3/4